MIESTLSSTLYNSTSEMAGANLSFAAGGQPCSWCARMNLGYADESRCPSNTRPATLPLSGRGRICQAMSVFGHWSDGESALCKGELSERPPVRSVLGGVFLSVGCPSQGQHSSVGRCTKLSGVRKSYPGHVSGVSNG